MAWCTVIWQLRNTSTTRPGLSGPRPNPQKLSTRTIKDEALRTTSLLIHTVCWWQQMSWHTTAVPMLANDVSMTTLRSDTQTLADLETEPRGVEHRSTADHTMHRQTTQLPCHVRHHVHCMCHTHTSTFNHPLRLCKIQCWRKLRSEDEASILSYIFLVV